MLLLVYLLLLVTIVMSYQEAISYIDLPVGQKIHPQAGAA
jgi:hypothetical protein